MNIAILVPVCSRNQKYSSFEDIPFLKYLYPSFEKTKEDGYNYTFFIGYDDDDEFYINNSQFFSHNTFCLQGCQHAPANAWNKLAEIVFNSEVKYDYFFQIGDDVILETPGWTTAFIDKLSRKNNIGIVGPCHLNNYNGRVSQGRPYVIENAFVSRKHMEIFGYFFHPSIKNWFCDDWITQIYKNTFSEIQINYTCCNAIMDRYAIAKCHNISTLIEEGSLQVSKYTNSRRCFSYCVFGNQKKYCQGMVRNLEQIQQMFPDYKVTIYLGNDVPQEYIDKYMTYNVNLIQRDFTGLLITIHRFLALDDDYDVVFVRDADSRFGDRDIWCINHFLNSEHKVFTIRDHYYQMRPLMAGQTGVKKIPGISIEKKLNEFISQKPNINYYQNDQDFIEKYIFNFHRHETIAYVGFHNFGEKTTMQIPVPRKSDEDFCGNVYLFDGNEEYVQFTLHGEKSR